MAVNILIVDITLQVEEGKHKYLYKYFYQNTTEILMSVIIFIDVTGHMILAGF